MSQANQNKVGELTSIEYGYLQISSLTLAFHELTASGVGKSKLGSVTGKFYKTYDWRSTDESIYEYKYEGVRDDSWQ